MTSAPWRRIRFIAETVVGELRKVDLPEHLERECDRILDLVHDEDYIEAAPRIAGEAPKLDLSALGAEARGKYEQLMQEAAKFK